MKKAFDQTVRDLKREVNKKVLKVPGIEQKILDATNNEPWGPHGSHLADIAQATRNYHEYQMIMHVIWKRLNDIGKNWRHVYKGLTVLEYLVGHGSERVIDEIREHAYQIQTLADFQYIDSSGRDQGSNVRRKSQSLVALVNDKEKVQEVRQKALVNRDKFRSTFSTGGRYGDRYDDDRSEGRYRDSYDGRYKDDDRNGYGKERDWGSRDDERYGRGRDAYYRDGDHSGRDSDERYGQDRYRNDDYRGGRGNDDYQSGQRSRSSDRDGDRSYEDDDRYYSSRNGGRADDPSQDERRLERKLSEQSPPPSYEETVGDSNNNLRDESSKGNGNVAISAANAYSPPVAKAVCPQSTTQGPNQSMSGASPSASNKEPDEFDEFDPRSAVPAPECGSGVDLFATQSALDPINALALVPVDFNPASEADAPSLPAAATNFVPLSSASSALSQPSEDPFGDGQFKATPQGNFQAQNQGFAPAPSFQPSSAPPAAPRVEPTPTFDFGDSLGGLTYTPTVVNGHQHFAPPPSSMPAEFPMTQASNNMYTAPPAYTSQQFVVPPVYTSQQFTAPSNTYTNTPTPNVNYPPQSVPNQQTTNSVNLLSQPGLSSAHTATTQTALTLYEQPAKAQQPTDKFETKSTVWADTLNRGLVNLNISGAKTNPLADIGVDFEAINRMDKRKQKSSAAPATSTVTMGKAMGSGSGIVRAGASGVATTSNSVMGPGVGMGMGTGMGMGIGPGPSMGMGGYGGGMNQPMGMGMGMNMGMNPGAPMRPPPIQGQGMYSPMMGMGGYGSQQPYGGGGYR